MENQCLQDEGVDCSSSCMRAFVWDSKGSHRILFHFKYDHQKGLELTASTIGSTFGKEEVGIRFLPSASSLPQIMSMKD
jgi:hypothetical protein